jgi:hypothetical protein
MRRTRMLAALAGGISLLSPALVRAHFVLQAPPCWMSQDSSGMPEKGGPCGNEGGGTATGTVTPVVAGQTVSVTVNAVVPHPGWWRIALAQGASSSQTLTSLPDPVPQAGTNCTPAIVANPVWSTTQPILADGLPAGSVATTNQAGVKTFQVTIPENAACTAAHPCALQVIMVMTDHPAGSCYYHHCADITMQGPDGGGGAGGNGGDAGGQTGTAGSAGSVGSGGGCSVAASKTGWWGACALALLALAALTRRRR